MARRSRQNRNRDKSNRDPLDDLDIETPVARPTPSPAPLARAIRQKSVLEDRRNWAPRLKAEPSRMPARDTLGRPARLVHKNVAFKVRRGPNGKPLQSAKKFSLVRLAENSVPRFAEARKAIICAKRAIRKEVLFALDRTRSGAGKPKRRNEWSDVQCSKDS